MGIFDIFKKKTSINQVSQKLEINRNNMLENPYPYVGLLPNGLEYTIYNFEVINYFVHRDGRQTAAIMAKIQQAGHGDTINPDFADYISFEIDPGVPVTPAMCQTLIEGYVMCKGIYGVNQTFIGKLIEPIPGEVSFEKGSDVVANYMEQEATRKLDKRIAVLKQRSADSNESARKEQAGQIKRFEAAYKNRQQRKKAKIEERLNNPYFYKRPSFTNAEEYDGVNLSTGNIIRLRAVEKIGKTDNGTYLYTAFIRTVQNEDEVEILSKDRIPEGYPIAFETDLKLSDIAQFQDPNDIRCILTLLNINEHQLSQLKLSYIGRYRRDGIVSRTAQSDFEIINDKIAQLKEEFKQKLMRRSEGR